MPHIDFKIKPNFLRPELLQHGQIPRPLASVAPRLILGQDWWDTERRKAYAANNYLCWACGSEEMLQAHEAYDFDYSQGTLTFREVTALCSSCHSFIHAGYTGILVSKGIITSAEFKRIMLHGHRVLRKAKLQAHWTLLSVLQVYTESWAQAIRNNIGPYPEEYEHTWSAWRMVIAGKAYPPRFRTPQQADKFYEER